MNDATTDAPSVAPEANARQALEWNGENGVRWLANQDRLDRMLEPFGEAALAVASVQSGDRVLDVGCGCGPTTLALARLVEPSGAVTGVDISALLLQRARERADAAGLPIRFDCADASRYPLEAGSLDLLFSRFGVMFFDDPGAAFSHLAGALRAGGRLVFVCWRGAAENGWLSVPMQAAEPLLPPEPEPDPEAPGPLAFARRDRILSVLHTAGFRDIEVQPFDITVQTGFGADATASVQDAATQAMQAGPLARQLRDIPDGVRRAVHDAVQLALAPFAQADGVRLPAGAWIVSATR